MARGQNSFGLNGSMLLAVRGERGKWTSVMPLSVAQTLLKAAVTTEGEYIFPRAALESAGCNIGLWEKAAKLSEGSAVRELEMHGQPCFSVPIDGTKPNTENPIVTTLRLWANPEWRAEKADQIQAQR